MVLSIIGVYIGLSFLTYIAYWMDKRAAQRKRSRIPETTLLSLGLIGGWPGGLLAQQTLRHKTRKLIFQVLFWLSALLNVAVIAYILRGGHGS